MKRILTILMALAVMTTVAAKPQKDGEAQGKERKTEKKAKKKKPVESEKRISSISCFLTFTVQGKA